jgi:chromosome segregation ATPase
MCAGQQMKVAACLVFVVMGTGFGTGAHAQTQRSGSDTARVTQQLQQLSAERIKLQQQNAELQRQLDGLKSQAAGSGAAEARLGAQARQLQADSERLRSESAATTATLDKTRGQLQELVAKYRDLAQTLREVEADRNSQHDVLAVNRRQLDSCSGNNAQLYEIGSGILDRLEERGLWSALKDKEAFTRLSRTRLENLADDYRARISALRLSGK